MSEFLEYSPFSNQIPPSSGAYNIVIFSRDGVPVISVAFYNHITKKWYRQYIEEYGYCDQHQMEDNYISYFKLIEGVEFNVIPEDYKITIPGVKTDE
jgi:hypothetical protein